MAGRFPKDCPRDCPNFSEYDLSIDDLVCQCPILGASCDACDEDFSFALCPLPFTPDGVVPFYYGPAGEKILLSSPGYGDAEGPPGEPGVILE